MDKINDFRNLPLSELFEILNTRQTGLTDDEARSRLKKNDNIVEKKTWISDLVLFFSQFKSPLVLILIAAVILSFSLRDYTNSSIILIIIILSGMLGFWQERNASHAINKLKSLVQVNATVKRSDTIKEIPLAEVVPGDIILLNAGDIIPGDGRLIECNDLHVNEAMLTGESFPSEKSAAPITTDSNIHKRFNSVFQGTSVINGTATAVVVATGKNTAFGKIRLRLGDDRRHTAFEKGIEHFGYLLLYATLVFSLLILLLNMYMRKPVIDSILFALALAIGITPELLPAIITISLATGAKRMADKKVIVKKLTAIQNLGSIDVICTDKTGTLTEGIVKVHSAVDIHGNSSSKVSRYAYLNSKFESGFTNPLDEAIRRIEIKADDVSKIDEVPYDFIRKRLSVVIDEANTHIMITKGAVKNILDVCTKVETPEGKIESIDLFRKDILKLYEEYGTQGFRTIGLSYKDVTGDPIINKDDENDLIFIGLIILFDPPKSNIAESIMDINAAGINVKLLTGDNASVARFLARQIGLRTDAYLTGNDLRTMSDAALVNKVQQISVFAETEPDQKERIVRALKGSGHVVGFLGDGINDAAAMRAADVGISVNTAVDIAKETADIVLLESDLDVLYEGVREGRKTFLNTLKYIFITSSANFGNMFSMAGASLVLPFLPLLPKQILLINFLTDLPGMALASDSVDKELLRNPQTWNNRLIRNFMIVFGLQSAIFDYLAFFMLFYLFNADASQFRTAWFFECIITELIIIILIRTRGAVWRSRPGKYLLYALILTSAVTCVFTFPPFSTWFSFVPVPLNQMLAIMFLVILYGISAEFVKRIFFKRATQLNDRNVHGP